ncbi:MAG: hypothetical protein II063_10465 [Prevotella sp.]|nr:hypothetical protein [Prevotella sp.]
MKLFVVNLYYGIIVYVAESKNDVVEMMRGDKELWDQEFRGLDGSEWSMEDVFGSIYEIPDRKVIGHKGSIAYYKE